MSSDCFQFKQFCVHHDRKPCGEKDRRRQFFVLREGEEDEKKKDQLHILTGRDYLSPDPYRLLPPVYRALHLCGDHFLHLTGEHTEYRLFLYADIILPGSL